MLDAIKRRINEKGWNFYQVDDSSEFESYMRAVEHGPVDILTRGAQYVLFPQVEDPRSLDHLEEASLRLMRKNSYPSIERDGETIPVGAIRVYDERIVLQGYDPGDLVLMSHEEFYRKIDDLPRA